MNKFIYIFFLIISTTLSSQKTNLDQWTDLFSYNKIQDFINVEDKLYAITDNSTFNYDINTGQINKLSIVDGLSNGLTSSISYDKYTKNIIIGYQNGLVDIIDRDQNVTSITDINQNSILINRKVNGFWSNNEISFLYGDFGVIEFNREKNEFGERYTLSSNNIPTSVIDLEVFQDNLYVTTDVGLFKIDISDSNELNPVRFSDWELVFSGKVSDLIIVNNNLLFTSLSKLKNVFNPSIDLYISSSNILSLNFVDNQFSVTTSNLVQILNTDTFLVEEELNLELSLKDNLTTKKGIKYKGKYYISSDDFGILATNQNEVNFIEIHPEGPNNNDTFSINVNNGDLWISYGGYSRIYNFLQKKVNVSGFYNNQWYHIPYSEFKGRDIVDISINTIDDSKVYLGSYLNGVKLLEFENNRWSNTQTFDFDTTEGGIAKNDIFGGATITKTVTDANDRLWVAHSFARDNKLFSSYNFNTERWEALVDFSSIISSSLESGVDVRVTSMYIHSDGNIFAGTSRQGLLVFKDSYDQDNGTIISNTINVINNQSNSGALRSNRVRAVIVDENERVWIGTDQGLVVFDDYESLFERDNSGNLGNKRPATTIIIEENNDARELLGNSDISDIIIDKIGTKWIATRADGVFNVSSDGQITHHEFNSSNSPLPSNVILDLELDESTGLLYIVTDSGIVVFDNKIEPFSDTLTSVVAYPNPALRTALGHEVVTIVSKDGNGIPVDTNVKILDVSGKLVFETNVLNNGSSIGGKIEWDKRNLRGNLVTSGIYIVLLSSPDGTENTTTKIAIVN